jgi:hypothetical protein
VSLRDDVEAVIRSWDVYEQQRGCPPVIDYDCTPAPPAEPVEALHRLDAADRLTDLSRRADDAGDGRLVERIGSHLAYLRARVGEQIPLDDYISSTQGCPAAGWPPDHVLAVGDRARAVLGDLGIAWGSNTDSELKRLEGEIDAADVRDAIFDVAGKLDAHVRPATGSSAAYSLNVETADVDAYWAYWLDGARGTSRLRLNMRRAKFTPVRVRYLVLHEVFGHALQGAAWAEVCASEPVTWVRFLSVHAQHQVLLEGLADALPFFVCPDDEILIARLHLMHYLHLVRAELHVAINRGASVATCIEHARRRAPFWSSEDVADILTDRSVDPLLRTYLWAYPAGLDWFVALANSDDADTIKKVLHAAYQSPLTPDDLAALWPAGPPIGGPGGSVRLWDPAVP